MDIPAASSSPGTRSRSNSSKQRMKLVEMPAAYSGSAGDKKWNFVDEEQNGNWGGGYPMYFPPPVMFVARRPAGEVSGARKVEEIQMVSGAFMAKVYTYGAILAELHIPDAYGQPVDVVLGFPSFEGYTNKHPKFGCNVGRVANRIAGGSFELGGEKYSLEKNNGENCIHGGAVGWDKAVWTVLEVDSPGCSVKLGHTSPDGDEGFPGKVNATIHYFLAPNGVLRIEYAAEVEGKATPINMAHHSYFNLAGHGAGSVLAHAIQVAADSYTPVGEDLIPTGEIQPVEGVPGMDLRQPQPISESFEAREQCGLDYNFVLGEKPENTDLTFAASLQDASGRYMEVHTTAPGLQVYTADNLDGSIAGKEGVSYQKNGGVCFETQGFPDAVHHANFPSVIVEPGETYNHVVEYRFFC